MHGRLAQRRPMWAAALLLIVMVSGFNPFRAPCAAAGHAETLVPRLLAGRSDAGSQHSPIKHLQPSPARHRAL